MAALHALLAKFANRGNDDDDEDREQLTIQNIVDKIKNGEAKNIVCMTGAGLSVAAGIPDFRSPGTGLYDNLAKYNLPYPEAVFELKFFQKKPEPFFALSRELMPRGQYFPTYAHYFIALLAKKGLLTRCFTQNIDGLEYLTHMPEDLVVTAHGSFRSATCMGTGKKVDVAIVKAAMEKGEIPISPHDGKSVVKPDIVFFGEGLPDRFGECARSDFPKCDMLIVMGTSLVVYPFAGLVDEPENDVPRVLINREPAGSFKNPGWRDVLVLGDLESEVLDLADQLGWKQELIDLREAGNERIRSEAPPEADVTTKGDSETGGQEAAAEAAARIAAVIQKSLSEDKPADAPDASASAASAAGPPEEQQAAPEPPGRQVATLEQGLAVAVVSNDGHAARRLLQEGANPNHRLEGQSKVIEQHAGRRKQSEASVSMLDIAVQARRSDIVELLLEHGAKPNEGDEGGSTPLMLAAQLGDLSTVRSLLAGGADVNSEDIGGGTALIRAAEVGSEDIVLALIESGANVNHRGKWVGGTALHWGVAGGNVDIIKMLITAGCDPTVKNKQGMTALDMAKQLEIQDIMEVLSKAEADKAESA